MRYDMSYYPDISHYHPVEDWSKVKANCPFLISKATQGTSYVDTTLEDFISGCEKNKIPYWLYAYLSLGNELAQAKYLVSTCKGLVGDYFRGYVLDVEAGNTAANVKAALDYLEGLGGKCIIYTMYAQYSTYKSVITGRGEDTAWWEARYGKNDGSYSSSYPAHDGADLHQYTSKGSCPGISGDVCDLNRLTGTKAESWFTGAATTTTTTVAVKTATDNARSYLKTLAGTYKAAGNLNVRNGAGTGKSIMVTIPSGTKVECYGYYTTVSSVKWLYVQFTYKNTQYTGFCSSNWLTKL